MNTLIVSLKHAPGLLKEFLLLGQNLEQQQYNVRYLLSKGYSWQLPNGVINQTNFVTTSQTAKQVLIDSTIGYIKLSKAITTIIEQTAPEIILIYNPHPLNEVLLNAAQKKNPACYRAVYLHEPYKPDKSSFGRWGSRYYALTEYIQTRSLRYINQVILPSPHAAELFTQRYPDFKGDTHEAPILLPDIEHNNEDNQRCCISLVGTVNKSRGLDEFVTFINFAVIQDSNIRFQIVTRSAIAESIQNLSEAGLHATRIINKPQISDNEITDALRRSKALFLPHKQVTQSGNVPVSFRVGTPIIARDLRGFTQHIHHQVNGVIIPVDSTNEDLLRAYQYIDSHLAEMSENARNSFETIFCEKNWSRYYHWLLSDQII